MRLIRANKVITIVIIYHSVSQKQIKTGGECFLLDYRHLNQIIALRSLNVIETFFQASWYLAT